VCKYIGLIFEKIHSFACQWAFDDIFHHISPRYTPNNKRIVNFLFLDENSWVNRLVYLKNKNYLHHFG
jgi:hypothetical protein